MERIENLRKKAAALPLLPGVYIMKNKSGEIIYIGKAKALKNRVTQYFGSSNNHTEKVRRMVSNVNDFEYILEGSISLDDLDDRLELKLESEEYDSLGGFIIERLDRHPEVGDEIVTESGLRLVVDSLDKNRVEKVHIYIPEDFYEEDDDEDEDEE